MAALKELDALKEIDAASEAEKNLLESTHTRKPTQQTTTEKLRQTKTQKTGTVTYNFQKCEEEHHQDSMIEGCQTEHDAVEANVLVPITELDDWGKLPRDIVCTYWIACIHVH